MCTCSMVSYIEGLVLRRISFSDKSRFLRQRCDGQTSVYMRRNERFDPGCVQENDRFGGGSVRM